VDIFNLIRDKYPDLEFGEYSSQDGRDTFISLAVEQRIELKTKGYKFKRIDELIVVN